MFLKKLDDLMSQKGINKNILSKECGIPYTTIDSFYKKGYDNVKLSTLKKLSEYFDVSVNYFVYDSDPDNVSIVSALNPYEQNLLNNYRQLNDEGKEKATEYISDLVTLGRYKKHNIYEMDTKQA